MKALLISIRPQWVEKILNGIKKDEIRKGTAIGKAINRLIKEQGVAPTFIYCTKQYQGKSHAPTYYLNGKVVARFNAIAEEIVTVNRLDTGKVVLYRGHENGITNRKLMEGSCLTFDEMNNYLQGKIGTDIHINDLEIFDKPKEISEFHKAFPQSKYLRFKTFEQKRAFALGGFYEDNKAEFVTKTSEEIINAFEKHYSLTKAPQSWCYVEI